jgi:hypothetical protein
MDDQEILARIGQLADEERKLEESHVGEGLNPTEHERLESLQTTLDQLWDLLRQRRALRESGRSPDAAATRPADVVEKFQQ